MCVSLLQLTSDLGNGVCDQFALDGVVGPPKMRSGLFTVAAADNIDYNPSATTAKILFMVQEFLSSSILLMNLKVITEVY